VHYGHLRAAEEVCDAGALEAVWLLPANLPPHKAPVEIAPAAHRVRMLELALAGQHRLRVEPIELERDGPSYTIDTLDLLAARHPGRRFALIVGLDSFRELHTWHRFDEIPARCDLIVTSRPPHAVAHGPQALVPATDVIAVRQAFWYESDIGSFRHLSGHRLDFVPVTAFDVSASAIRRAVAAGRSIRYLTPDSVAAYIHTHGLYQAPQIS
jgi:nicotinate-nucleotide adenylyltransferase